MRIVPRILSLAAIFFFAAGGAIAAEGVVTLQEDAVVRFATVEEGSETLARRDAFIESLSKFDLQARLQTSREATADDLLEFARRQVSPWRPEQIERFSTAFASIREKLAGLRPCLPAETLLIQTTGREEGGAAYTRGAAIILSAERAALPDDALERLLLHELFHVLSRHDAALRAELYGIIGFEPIPEVALPPALRDRKITNPDAPKIDCRISLDHEGRKADFAPLLLATPPKYDPESDRSFFGYLNFRLIEIEQRDGRWQAALKEGEPTLIDPRQGSAFFDRIGRNTSYIIHPDEILADNFALMAAKAEKLASPAIVAAMRQALSQPAAGER